VDLALTGRHLFFASDRDSVGLQAIYEATR
jgi:hypothetical protein